MLQMSAVKQAGSSNTIDDVGFDLIGKNDNPGQQKTSSKKILNILKVSILLDFFSKILLLIEMVQTWY